MIVKVILYTIVLFSIISLNFKALGLATGATGNVIGHGFAMTLLQPLYLCWSVYYLTIGYDRESPKATV